MWTRTKYALCHKAATGTPPLDADSASVEDLNDTSSRNGGSSYMAGICYFFHPRTRSFGPGSAKGKQMQKIKEELTLLERVAAYDTGIEARTPSYCAGCPHRGTSSAVMEIRKRFADAEYMRRAYGRETVDMLAHGGIGCYSLNFLPPFRDMHDMAAMGLGGAAGLGAGAFTKNKHYVLCGDSTFFHSEMSTLSNAIKDNQDILYIILDNKNTAMTGHQPTAASAYDLMGYRTISQDIESVVRGMDSEGKVFIRRTDPSRRDDYIALLEAAFLMDGVRVVIADRECGITFHKRKRRDKNALLRREGFLRVEKHINISPDACENCRACTLATGCPGLTVIPTNFGEKIGIDPGICVDDKYCTRIKACPSFEQVVITRRRPPVPATAPSDFWMRDMPDPPGWRPGEGGRRDVFSVFVPGVGGMGLGFVARILTAAGAAEGYEVRFYHQKGLAQRNGAVVSHVLYSRPGLRFSQRIPDGKADLVLGLDHIETARGLWVAGPQTMVLCNTARTPTILMLTGEDRYPDDVDERIMSIVGRESYFGADFFAVSEHYFGERVYANLLMLGVACQRGLLPLRPALIEDVIRESVKKEERENNLRAFRIGRRIALDPECLPRSAAEETFEDAVAAEKARFTGADAKRAGAYAARMREFAGTWNVLPGQHLRDFAHRYADLELHSNRDSAEHYSTRVEQVLACEMETGRTDHEAAGSVIAGLHKVMAIKDEVWVARLLTESRKLAADRRRYNIDPSRGDSIRHLHFNRPHFNLFGITFEWDMRSRDWMLRITARMKVLRKLMPRWHRREKEFRDWYDREVIGAWLQGIFTHDGDGIEALRLPLTCTGYREIVYPKYERARLRFEELRARGKAPEGTGFPEGKT